METFPTLSNEVYHDEVQQDVRKDEVCECPLGADARKLTLVLGIDLKRFEVKWVKMRVLFKVSNRKVLWYNLAWLTI